MLREWATVIERIRAQSESGSKVLMNEFATWWEGLLMEDYMKEYSLPGWDIECSTVMLAESKGGSEYVQTEFEFDDFDVPQSNFGKTPA